MTNLLSQLRGAARRAIILGLLAMASFFCPAVLLLLFKIYRGPLGIFIVLYLIFAFLATASSIVATKRGDWPRPDWGKRFLIILYGVPVLTTLLLAALFSNN